MANLNFRIVLLIMQLYVHAMFIVGLFALGWTTIIPTVIICQIIFVGLCGTVFFHRVVAHKHKIPHWLENVLLVLSTIGISGSALAWAGTHRAHHRYSDTEKDPHSPKMLGYFRAYWYSSGTKSIFKLVPDLLRKPNFMLQHKYYFEVIILYHLAFILFAPFAMYWIFCIVPPFLMWFAGSTINCFGHGKDGPRDNNFLGIVFAGEGWHAHHHDNPADPTFKSRLDWGGRILSLIKVKNE